MARSQGSRQATCHFRSTSVEATRSVLRLAVDNARQEACSEGRCGLLLQLLLWSIRICTLAFASALSTCDFAPAFFPTVDQSTTRLPYFCGKIPTDWLSCDQPQIKPVLCLVRVCVASCKQSKRGTNMDGRRHTQRRSEREREKETECMT